MKLSGVLLALAAATSSVVSAQSLPALPDCSMDCVIKALSGDGCSTLTDFACHCKNPTLVGQLTGCVQKACLNPADRSSVSAAATSLCSAAGHPISVPSVSGTIIVKPTPAAADCSTTGTTAPAATVPPVSVPPTSVPPVSIPTSHVSGIGSASGSGSGGGGGGSGAKTITTSATSTTTSLPLNTGAAANLQANLGGVAAVLAAAAFAL